MSEETVTNDVDKSKKRITTIFKSIVIGIGVAVFIVALIIRKIEDIRMEKTPYNVGRGMEHWVSGVWCMIAICYWIFVIGIYIAVIIQQQKNQKMQQISLYKEKYADIKDGRMTIKEFSEEMISEIKIKPYKVVSTSYKPEQLHYGSVTVGGVTTGGVYKTGGYNVEQINKTNKFYIEYLGEHVNSIYLPEDYIEIARKSSVAKFLHGNKLILLHEMPEFIRQEILKKVTYNGSTVLTTPYQLTHEECENVINLLMECGNICQENV